MSWLFGIIISGNMDRVKNKSANMISKLKRTGFFSVFLVNVLAKVLSFLGSIVIVRILSKDDFGLYAYIMNCYSMLFLLNDFGCNVAMIQFRSENYSNVELYNDYFTFPLKCALAFSALSSLLIVFSPIFYPFTQEAAKNLTKGLFLLPIITTINTFLSSNLRVEMQNTKFAILSFLQVLFHFGFILPMSFFWNVQGALLANYMTAILLLFCSIIISRKRLNFEWISCSLNIQQKKAFLKYAFASQINNSIGGLFHLLDIFLIGLLIVDNQVISSYKVASTIPQALLFIPNSILIYAGPLFARNIKNIEWVKRNFNRITFGCAGINGIAVLVGVCTAYFFIPLIFGTEYTDAVPCFIILMLAFFVQGTFQIPSNNIIYTQHKVNANVTITIVTSILNCILDIWFISNYGAIGAAVATLSVSIAASVMSYGYMRFWLNHQGA